MSAMSAKFQDKEQNDLFEQFQATDKRIRRKTRFLLPNIKNSLTLSYESIVFIAIGFLMCCIISFSLGVEKGRYDVICEKNRQVASDAKIKKEGGISNVSTSKPKNLRSR